MLQSQIIAFTLHDTVKCWARRKLLQYAPVLIIHFAFLSVLPFALNSRDMCKDLNIMNNNIT